MVFKSLARGPGSEKGLEGLGGRGIFPENHKI